MTDTAPVEDWATDYDIFDSGYIEDPVTTWSDLRGRCPIAHTDRWEGSYLPTRYEDVQAMAKMVPELSSRDPLVVRPPEAVRQDADFAEYGANAPPITADPPLHGWTRRLMLPSFSPKAVQIHREYTEELCDRLIDGFIADGQCDGAVDYAQQIPPRVIAHLLGVDESRVDDFVFWVRNVLELGLSNPELRVQYRDVVRDFFREQVADRQANPRDDFITELLAAEHEGEPIPVPIVVGMCNLLLIAGIDTTWSSIGSALWHMATQPTDRKRLAADPELFPTAVEELLRFHSPVTMAREVVEEVDYGGVTFTPGDKILMNFPGANRDPDEFENADEFQIDRQRNRHIAFGAGIHRCVGSNLARMEMDVALRKWFARIPEFEVSDPDQVTWAGGQVRGPRTLPISFPN